MIQALGVAVTLVALLAAGAVPLSMRSQTPAGLAGTVSDVTGAAVPGARVTVIGGTLRRTAVTDASGRYRVLDLPPGTYTVHADLAGFERETAHDVVASAGSATVRDFVLRVQCLDEVVRIDVGMARAVAAATSIVRLRILDSVVEYRCAIARTCVCTRHLAQVVAVTRGTLASHARIRLHQDGAGRQGEPSDEEAYAAGREYFAFLRLDPATGDFVRAAGAFYVFPIRDGQVEFTRPDAPGLVDGMPIDAFATALQTLVRQQPAR